MTAMRRWSELTLGLATTGSHVQETGTSMASEDEAVFV